MGYNDTIKQLRLRTRVQLRAALCGVFMLLLGTSQEVTKKDAKTFPLGSPLSVPLYKDKDEKNRYSYPVSLATEPTRAAGEESKRFCGYPKGIRPFGALLPPLLAA